jgi:hypothetical protein
MKRYTESQRRVYVSEFECSGLTQEQFCQQRGISSLSLRRWRRLYAADVDQRRNDCSDVPSGAQWVSVVCSGQDPSLTPLAQRLMASPAYGMVCATGRLEVPSGFDVREVELLWQIVTQHSSQGVVS